MQNRNQAMSERELSLYNSPNMLPPIYPDREKSAAPAATSTNDKPPALGAKPATSPPASSAPPASRSPFLSESASPPSASPGSTTQPLQSAPSTSAPSEPLPSAEPVQRAP